MQDTIAPTITPLYAKLASIMGEVARVPKNGHNAFHKYDYVTESDLVVNRPGFSGDSVS